MATNPEATTTEIEDVESNDQFTPVQTEKRSNTPSNGNRKILLLAGGVILAIVILFAILIPTVIIDKHNGNSNELFTAQGADSNDDGSTSGNKLRTNQTGSTAQDNTHDSGSSNQNSSSTQTNDTQPRFVEFHGPFNGRLPLFDSRIAEGYNVRRNTGANWNTVGYLQRDPLSFTTSEVTATDSAGMLNTDSSASGTAGASSANPVGEDVNSFETNNQEKNVVEADVIKSDGKTVFAAYGDYIVMWNAKNGTNLGQVKLPTIDEEGSKINPIANATDKAYWAYSKPSVTAMLLYDDRLVVIVDGYGGAYRTLLEYDPVLTDYRNTRIYVYDASKVSTGGKLEIIAQTDVNGSYSEARAIGSNIHMVTMSGINYYPFFETNLQRYLLPENVTDEEYIKIVQNKGAKEIPEFVNELTQELIVNGGLPDIARMSVMQTEWNASQANNLVYDGGINNFYVQVSSFDVTSSTLVVSDSSKLDLSVAGAFLPFYDAQVYAAVDTLIIAANGYDYMPDSWAYNEFTYLLAMALDGPSATTKAVGQVPGTLMNNYAMDVFDNVLRIGTTVRQSGWCCGPWIPTPMPLATVSANSLTSSSGSDVGMYSTTSSEVGVSASDSTNARSEITTNTVPPDESTLSPTIDSIPTNTLPPSTDKESSTINYITTLKIPDKNGDQAGNMTQLGQLKLGKKDESFTTIRFFDNIAYAVTFLRRDPFYALDLSNPKHPKVLGELNITGFSDYLHSMNDNNTLILGVGQEADANGTVLGLQITVYDVRDASSPRVANRYTFELDDNTYSSSDASWDFKSIRYDQGSKRLILPVDISNWQDPSKEFHGFYVFFVNESTIASTCRIQHGSYDTNGDYCYYCAFFPKRSMIFNGNVTTVSSHYVRSTNLNTCKSEWELEIKLSDPNDGCCGWY